MIWSIVCACANDERNQFLCYQQNRKKGIALHFQQFNSTQIIFFFFNFFYYFHLFFRYILLYESIVMNGVESGTKSAKSTECP